MPRYINAPNNRRKRIPIEDFVTTQQPLLTLIQSPLTPDLNRPPSEVPSVRYLTIVHVPEANHLRVPRLAEMITRFITEVTTKFNPFSPRAKTARIFLSLLPPNARQAGMKINTTLYPRGSKERSVLSLKFKDGKEMKLDTEKLQIKDVMEEVDRHSRILGRQEELTAN
ncbi:MAG: 39S ribosomal protein L44, mitochondrial [Geoglossum umbratile]|nr:MAG: 39S ribosomal protein L44, mitochondrial [Geoglossum umbratile]